MMMDRPAISLHMSVDQSALTLLSTTGMPTFAPQLSLLTLLLAVFAAVFAPFTTLCDQTGAGRMGTFLRRICHTHLATIL